MSFWVNSFLSGIAFGILNQGGNSFIASAKTPIAFAFCASVTWSLKLAISVWLFVGIWRSASRHTLRGGRKCNAVIAKFVVVMGLIGLVEELSVHTVPRLMDRWSIVFGDPTVGKHELNILPGGIELEFAGGIRLGVTDEVLKLLEADKSIRVIRLNSAGGRIGEAMKLGYLIHERGLVTYVLSDCASACTEVFMGGVQRYVSPGARLGFHGGRIDGGTEDELARANDIGRRSLIARGVADWFASRAFSTPNTSIWWPTIDELTQADVITGVARPEDFALSARPFFSFDGRVQTATAEDLDKELQKAPLYVAIKRAEPETYRAILVAVVTHSDQADQKLNWQRWQSRSCIGCYQNINLAHPMGR